MFIFSRKNPLVWIGVHNLFLIFMSFNLYIIILLILNNKYNCHSTHMFFIILLFWLNIFLRVFVIFFFVMMPSILSQTTQKLIFLHLNLFLLLFHFIYYHCKLRQLCSSLLRFLYSLCKWLSRKNLLDQSIKYTPLNTANFSLTWPYKVITKWYSMIFLFSTFQQNSTFPDCSYLKVWFLKKLSIL